MTCIDLHCHDFFDQCCLNSRASPFGRRLKGSHLGNRCHPAATVYLDSASLQPINRTVESAELALHGSTSPNAHLHPFTFMSEIQNVGTVSSNQRLLHCEPIVGIGDFLFRVWVWVWARTLAVSCGAIPMSVNDVKASLHHRFTPNKTDNDSAVL